MPPSPMATFFVSYRRSNEAARLIAAELQAELETRGHTVFVDERSLLPGQNWPEEIRTIMPRCDYFLLLISGEIPPESHVREEVRLAAEARTRQGRPDMVPVRVSYDGPVYAELQQLIAPIQQFQWRRPAHTTIFLSRLLTRVDAPAAAAPAERQPPARAVEPPELPSPPPRPPRIPRRALGWIATAVALVAILVAFSAIQVRALRCTSAEDQAMAAYGTLRRLRLLLLPRAWLRGGWNPEALARTYLECRATELDQKAAPLLQNPDRRTFDQGLMLAALAAMKRGVPVAAEVRKLFDGRNYSRLLMTLRAPALSGTAVATSRHGRSVAAGTTVWLCREGRPLWGCRQSAVRPLPMNAPIVGAAFRGDHSLVIIDDLKQASIWSIGHEDEIRKQDLTEPDVAIDADTDEELIALAIEPEPFVLLYGRGGAPVTPRPPLAARMKSIAFGPCSGCLSMLGEDGAVRVWSWLDQRMRDVEVSGTATAITATPRGRRLAVATASGTAGAITFFDDALARLGEPVKPGVDLRGRPEMSFDDDGTAVAVVHDGRLTIVPRDGEPRVLAVPRPGTTGAAFAGNVLVSRTGSDVRLWDVEAASRREPEPTPVELWHQWRKQLGITLDNEGNIVSGRHGKPQWRWDPVAGAPAR